MFENDGHNYVTGSNECLALTSMECLKKFSINVNIFQGDIEENVRGAFSEHSVRVYYFPF